MDLLKKPLVDVTVLLVLGAEEDALQVEARLLLVSETQHDNVRLNLVTLAPQELDSLQDKEGSQVYILGLELWNDLVHIRSLGKRLLERPE